MAFGAHIFGHFILFSKSCIGQFLTVLWPVGGQFLDSSEVELWPVVFTACV